MKRIIAFLAVLLLSVCLSAGAVADTDSNPGGETPTPPHSPTTGSVALLVSLGAVAVGAGTVSFIFRNKSR